MERRTSIFAMTYITDSRHSILEIFITPSPPGVAFQFSDGGVLSRFLESNFLHVIVLDGPRGGS